MTTDKNNRDHNCCGYTFHLLWVRVKICNRSYYLTFYIGTMYCYTPRLHLYRKVNNYSAIYIVKIWTLKRLVSFPIITIFRRTERLKIAQFLKGMNNVKYFYNTAKRVDIHTGVGWVDNSVRCISIFIDLLIINF